MDELNLVKISYGDLKAKQKENYNFCKISSILADYGFMTMRLSDDWQGADFIAQHVNGKTVLRVQLKGRLTVSKHYQGKDLLIAFPHAGDWFLCPHDALLASILAETGISKTISWNDGGGYSFPGLSKKMAALVDQYKIPV